MTKKKLEEPPPSYQVSPLTEALHSPEQSQSHRSNPFEHVSLLLKKKHSLLMTRQLQHPQGL